MDFFYNEMKKMSEKYSRVAMFVDMDGTIVEYKVFTQDISVEDRGKFINGRPLEIVIDKLKKINELGNVDIYILTLARSYIITKNLKTTKSYEKK